MYGYTGKVWPQDKVDELIKLHQEGYSASVIAEKIEMSRNAVIGKAWRLGLSFAREVNYPLPAPSKKKPEIKPLTDKQVAFLEARRLINIRRNKMKKKLTKDDTQLDNKVGVSIMDLEMEGGWPINCRAILSGEGIDAVYCGKQVYARSYCQEHFHRFYHTSREAQRAADRAAGFIK